MRKITEIIIHCTATPAGRNVEVEEIDRWHRARGFNGIGYHYVIALDGTVLRGRDISLPGAHCKGHNASSIGVCYVGGCDSGMHPADTRTMAQRAALKRFIRELRSRYPSATVHGHNEFTCQRAQKEARFKTAECDQNCSKCKFAAKACPSFDVKSEFR